MRSETEQQIYESTTALIPRLDSEKPHPAFRTQLILDRCRAEHPGLLGEDRERDAINNIIAVGEHLS